MPKGAYIGINNVARKIIKGYIGVDGVARRIRKAYVGVGGVARPFWSSEEIAYYGTAANLSVSRCDLAATHVGNYALFGGGYYDIVVKPTVDAYNTSLTRTIPTNLSVSRCDLAATHVGNYALFGGGYDDTSVGNASSVVDAYDATLTKTTAANLSVSRCYLVATHVGNYALFGGGYDDYGDTGDYSSTVDAYNTSLTRTIPTNLSVSRYRLAATHVGDYALFGGGYKGATIYDQNACSSTVDAYDATLTRIAAANLSEIRTDLAATHVGNYALFGGGRIYTDSSANASYKSIVDAYDTSLTRTTSTSLNVSRSNLAATHIGGYALFVGGICGNDGGLSFVDAYDTSLTRTIPTNLSVGKYDLAATHVGNYALFGGGLDDTNYCSSIVDVYVIVQ